MTTATRLTLEEFLTLPETEPAGEYVCGELIEMPMPTKSHAFIQAYLSMALFQFLAQTRLGRVATELRCIIGSPHRQRASIPDLVYIAQERLTADPYHLAAPGLAVEILSPGQSMSRFVDKILFYLLHGVRLVWVIDPNAKAILILEPGKDGRTRSAGDILDGVDVLPGFSVAVDDIFAQLQA